MVSAQQGPSRANRPSRSRNCSSRSSVPVLKRWVSLARCHRIATEGLASQAEPLGVDLDAGVVARLGADDGQRLVIGAVVGDHQLEGDLLRENPAQGVGQVARAIVGRDRDGQLRTVRHGSALKVYYNLGL